MSRRGKITEMYDLSALEAQQSKVLALANEFVDTINKFPKIKVELEGADKTKAVIDGMKKVGEATQKTSTSLKSATEAYEKMISEGERLAGMTGQQTDAYSKNIVKLLDLKKKYADVSSTVKQLTDLFNKGVTNDQLSKELIQATASQNQLKLSIQQTTQAITNQTKEAAAAGGSLNEMRAQLNQMRQQYDALSVDLRNGDIGASLLENIQKVDTALKASTFATGRFQDNVGNYSGALKTLEKALSDVRAKMDEFNKTGKGSADVVAELAKEEKLLEQLVNRQETGFASATQELKNNEKALQALANAGQENTAFYKELLQETAQLKDNVGDLKAEIKNLGSDTRTLDGLIAGAQALAGAYAAAQGVQALFGEESEDLQKTMVKLQAVMAIVTGLQSIQNALQKENAFRLLLTDIRTKAVAVSQFLFAKATVGSTIALRAFRGALLATGLGAIVILLSSFAEKMMALGDSIGETTDKLKQFNEAMQKKQEALQQSNDLIREGIDTQKQLAEQELAIAEKQGANQYEILARKKEIAELDKKSASEQVKNLELTAGRIAILEVDLIKVNNKRIAAAKDLEGALTRNNSTEISGIQKLIELYDLQIDGINGRISKGKELVTAERKAGDDIQKIEEDRAKFSQDERLKFQLADSKRRTDAAIRDNKIIAEDERKTLDVRLNAMRDIEEQQLKSNQAQKKFDLAQGGLTQSGRLTIQKNAEDQATQIKEAGLKEREQLIERYSEREKAAYLELTKNNIQAAADAAKEISENDENDALTRLHGLTEYYTKSQKLITAQRDYELQNTKLLESEKTVIKEKADQDTLALQRQFLKDYYDLAQAAAEKAGNDEFNRIKTQGLKQQIALLTGKKGLFDTEDDIQKQREISLLESNGKELKRELETLEERRALAEAYGKDTTELDLQIESKRLEIAENGAAQRNAVLELEISRIKKATDVALSIYSTIGAALNVGYEKQKNAIQEQIDLLEKQKQKDIELADATITNAQEKAAAIAVIEAKAQAQREALELKQRQIEQKKARFEKALNIAAIIQETALAVVRALGSRPFTPANIALAAGIGALGAAKLAIAVATPIPKYKTGTEDHAGGLAYVGDGGRKEIIQTPSGKSYITPDRKTLVNMPKHSKVLPDAAAVMDGLKMPAFRELPLMRERKIRESDPAVVESLHEINRTIKNQPRDVFKITRAGWEHSTRRTNRNIEWQNNNMQSRR